MGYLGLDVDHARALAERLRAGAGLAEHAQGLMTSAAALVDIAMPCVLVLDSLVADLELLARQVVWTVDKVTDFELAMQELTNWSVIPPPTRTPAPVVAGLIASAPGNDRLPVQSDAGANSAWDDVHQVSSHNSYAVVGGVDALFDHGVRSFELDIHRRPPAHGHFGDANDVDEWHIYHLLGWSHREYRTLPQGLAAIADLASVDPVTVFIDNKDGFGGDHTADAFDQVLQAEFGDQLYTPGDLFSQSPGATSLLDAVQRHGWPTAQELEGRILVVLTDNVDGYQGRDRLAFVAPRPGFTTTAGLVVHEPDDAAVFYNARADSIAASEVRAMNATNTILRTYFNPVCLEHFIDEEPTEVNYRAIDVATDGSMCETRVLVPPTPVPEPVQDL